MAYTDLRYILENINKWLIHIEQKNSFLLVANGVFLGIAVAYIKDVPTTPSTVGLLLIVTILASFAVNIVSFIPLGSGNGFHVSRFSADGCKESINHLYYEDIYNHFDDGKAYYEYWRELYQIKPHDLNEEVLLQYCDEICANAKMIHKKTQLAFWSAGCDFLGIFLFALIILMNLQAGR